jgi:hypothetical protein
MSDLYWYNLIMKNVIYSNDINLFEYIISNIKKENIYNCISQSLWFYVEDWSKKDVSINHNMLSRIFHYMGQEYIMKFINHVIIHIEERIPEFQNPKYIQLVDFSGDYIYPSFRNLLL